MDTLRPMYRVSFDDSPDIGSVAFSPNGKSVYVHVRIQAVDVWATLVYYWPEVVGGLAAIVILLAAWFAWRVIQRPQHKGQPHCRRCNYHLAGVPLLAASEGATAPRCSECGIDLTAVPPYTGRALARRLAVPVLVTLTVFAVYGAMLAFRAPRGGTVSHWFAWPVRPTNWLAQRAPAWLKTRTGFFDRVIEVETATGRRVRTVFTHRGACFLPMRVSPDGAWLYLTSADDKGFAQVNVATGREERTCKLWQHEHPETPGVIGFGDGGGTVFLAYLDELRQTNVIAAWTPTTGAVVSLVETPAFGGWPGRALLLGAEPPSFLVASNFSQAYQTKRYTFAVHSAAGMLLGPVTLPANSSPTSTPTVTPDGHIAFFASWDGVLGIDLKNGDDLGSVPLSSEEPLLGQIAMSPDGRLLFVSVHGAVILTRDIQARVWTTRLSYDAELIAPKLTVSPDGHWLAAVPFRDATVGGARRAASARFVHELLVFDLSSVQKK